MTGDQDHCEAYYADKLWNSLPATYRALDSDQFNANGPLRELVNRIGAQAAILRRGVDRMWEDQSIETCDDWVIPYIGELFATNLVPDLDPATMRRDVAKTIYYRRRKGTVAILEEIAQDITGWNARVVEFGRRLGRTRHGLDPAINLATIADTGTAALQTAQSLVGRLTQTTIGGLADLRRVYGASKAGSAFDEFFHTADFRQGQGRSGWYGIPRLGVFLWRLQSFGVAPTTPVESSNCPGQFTFDPTGRDIPLFAVAVRAYGDDWKAPSEWEVPTPITPTLLQLALGEPLTHPLYATTEYGSLVPNALGVFQAGTASGPDELVPSGELTADPRDASGAAYSRPSASGPLPRFLIDPLRGRLVALAHGPGGGLRVIYRYGFSSTIGAGPYDRRIGRAVPPTPPPPAPDLTGGGHALTAPRAIPGTGTVTVNDSLTYTDARPVTVQGGLTIAAGNGQRPVIRLAPTKDGWTEWTFNATPGSTGDTLVLDGLFLSGADVVLKGPFDSVTLTCCTLDPGGAPPPGAAAPTSAFGTAADGRDLVPCRLWIEGRVGTLTVERCITGPIRTRDGGRVETLTVTDSIIQAIPTAGAGPIAPRDVKDPAGLEERLRSAGDAAGSYLRGRSTLLGTLLGGMASASLPFSAPAMQTLLADLNALLAGPPLYDPAGFRDVVLSASTRRMLQAVGGRFSAPTPELNRRLLEDAFPIELADAALALSDGAVNLTRCTVLGRVAVHRLAASDCILRDLAVVDDTQHGCVRFTAWADGSMLPRQYESVRVPQGAQLFTAEDFGRPGYGQLLTTVDRLIPTPAGPTPPVAPTISAGAEDGSEMGAFSRERNPIKERGLLLKYQEYMPVGLEPVIIYVT